MPNPNAVLNKSREINDYKLQANNSDQVIRQYIYASEFRVFLFIKWYVEISYLNLFYFIFIISINFYNLKTYYGRYRIKVKRSMIIRYKQIFRPNYSYLLFFLTSDYFSTERKLKSLMLKFILNIF